MKCINCPCSNEIKNYDDCDWECLAHMEDDMYDDGCDLTEQEVNDIAEHYEEEQEKYIEYLMDCIKEEMKKKGCGAE